MKYFVKIVDASIQHNPPHAPTFRHEDPAVMCFRCNREFKLSEGKSSAADVIREAETPTVWKLCPHCGRDPHVDLEFESLGAALERIASQEGDLW